ncbi:extracellular protein [Companilactobacillus tucceti DSM 20183]|uniref:Extracellular protein n=1 Tax=Companilactobacillus tucceti DSM 20183 TaxID=1423811 RepID=A0A0R1IZJ9_9LACO|nr:hypothetical protein [Companilactobacillus tucceti]KRK64733.1 extracellular protein [Companilactobacillus tucceti DSM 20183]
MHVGEKNKKLLFIFLLLLSLVTTKLLDNNHLSINAASTERVSPVDEPPEDPDDLHNALATAPRGLDISDPTFQRGFFTKVGSSENMNASKVIKRNDSDPADNTRILRVTHRTYQLGSIWSNIDQSNFLDISKDQTMSMWLYFGRPINPDNPKEVGDGMAFVLQNAQDDPTNIQNPLGGIRAISRFKGNPAPGQTLGVWGADMDNDKSNYVKPYGILPTAIQNSFAIEFDTFLNVLNKYQDISGEGVSFDYRFPRFGKPINGQHINMDYPDGTEADKSFDSDGPETYMPFSSSDVGGTKNYYMMNHNNLVDGLSLTDSKWHHMTVKFNHSTSTLSYTFDDKDNTTGTSIPNPISKSIKLDMSHFKLSGNKLRWGFTGSTGKYMENNLIVFESIPSFVSADSNTKIKDNTKNKVLTSTDKHVDSGDDLSFIYDLNYKNGSKDWSDILAKMNLPEQVTFTSGTIHYEDGSSEVIPLKEYSNNQVKHLLGKSLSNNMNHAQIELHTTVNMVDSQTKVPSTHVKFESDNFIIDDDNQDFIIDIPEMMISARSLVNIDDSSMDQIPDQIPINGDVWYTNGNSIVPSNVTLHANMGSYNNEFQLTKYNGTKATFDFDIPKTELIKGQNILTVYATDNVGRQTGKVQIVFTVAGNLEFGNFDRMVFFENVKQNQSDVFIKRQNGWHMEIIDGRSIGRSWTLQAKATDLIDETNGHKFNGNIVYRCADGFVHSLSNYQSIFSNTKNIEDTQKIDVASKWTDDSGILLQSGKSNSPGAYTGTIFWSLVDGLPNS